MPLVLAQLAIPTTVIQNPSMTIVLSKWAIHGLFLFVFSIQLVGNFYYKFAEDWIRSGDLWRPLYQLSRNHCPVWPLLGANNPSKDKKW